MKNLIFGITLMTSLATMASEKVSYEGVTPQGESCTLNISAPESSDYDNVLMRAKIGGSGIPTFLGFGTTKFTKSFQIVQFEHDGRLVSMGSEGDPDLELFENEQQELEGYTLHIYPIFGDVETYDCGALQRTN